MTEVVHEAGEDFVLALLGVLEDQGVANVAHDLDVVLTPDLHHGLVDDVGKGGLGS